MACTTLRQSGPVAAEVNPNRSTDKLLCPCGTGHLYRACCEPLLERRAIAASAEALMRSRYTAYARGREDYLLATWHVTTRPPSVALSPQQKFLELKVRRHVADPANPDRAIVEFVALMRVNGRGQRLHETSRFVREQDRWFYVDADGTDPRSQD